VSKNGKPYIEMIINGEVKQLPPEEISSMVLRNFKEIAESYLGHPIKDVVITVPAYFVVT